MISSCYLTVHLDCHSLRRCPSTSLPFLAFWLSVHFPSAFCDLYAFDLAHPVRLHVVGVCCGADFLIQDFFIYIGELYDVLVVPARECGLITYRHCRQPKLPNFLYSSNRLFCGGAADAGNATPTFCFSVPAISKLTTLTVESSWTAPTETAKHHILQHVSDIWWCSTAKAVVAQTSYLVSACYFDRKPMNWF